MAGLKNNKFLTGYTTALVLGVLGLGYFLWNNYTKHSEAQSAYEEAKSAVQSLESAAVYPDRANLDARKKQINEFATKVDNLQRELTTYQPEIKEIPDPSRFQTKLTETIKEIRSQAEVNGVKLANDFDLGLGKYTSELPTSSSVADLDYSLEAIKRAIEFSIANRVSAITKLTRTELDIEKGKVKEDDKTANKPGAKKGAGAASTLSEDKVLKRYSFILNVNGTERAIQDLIVALATAEAGNFFYGLRQVRIESENTDGPEKGGYSSSSGDEKSKTDSAIVLGGDKINAQLYLETYRFLQPEIAKVDDANK